MNLIIVPGLRFRKTETVTPELIGKRLTYLDRVRLGDPRGQNRFRAGDPADEAGMAAIIGQRQVCPPIDPQILLAETSLLYSALTLQAKLDSLPRITTAAGTNIMRGFITVELFKQVMADYDFGFGVNEALYRQLCSAQEQKKPVRNVTLELAKEFMTRLNTLTGRKFRLPTEEEHVSYYSYLDDALWALCRTDKVPLGVIFRMGAVNRGEGAGVSLACTGLRLAEDPAV